MKRQIRNIAFAVLFLFLLPARAQAAQLLIPGGQIIGLQLQNGTVTVAAFDDALGAGAREAGIKIGDEILSIGQQTVSCAEDVRSALTDAQGSVQVTVRRNGRKQNLTLVPRQTPEGPRLGLHLKQGISGIGTVTWYDPGSGAFAALGHGVNDAGGNLLKMTEGTAYRAQIQSVKKGKSGDPGLLKGNADPLGICGQIYKNTSQGIFGISRQGWRGEALPVGDFSEVQAGPAFIRSTVEGTAVQEYSVEILKIYPQERRDGRNFLLKVTDPALLAATGGIVQGMSGSPIIQNGRIVGAVTHVLVNDPTMGYGIYIGNMLDAAA